MYRLLIVDDDTLSRDFLTEAVRAAGHSVESVDGPTRALERVRQTDFDLVITDLRMPDSSGLDLIAELRDIQPDLQTLLITAHGSLETAIEAMRLGAVDFVQKPITADALGVVLERVFKTRRLERENAYLRTANLDSEPQLVARSEAMLETLDSAARIAASKGTVLITGESGTGKERVAQFLHSNSQRSGAPFIRVNCAALSEQLLESELFGHERGAFTGAHRRREGRFELANGGTLLLDEIGEISPALQAKLLRVLEEEEFERVGGTQTLKVDVRVIATTNRNLPDEVASGRFREDLYYRLHVLPLHLAPLRERGEDILPLAEHFARHYARQHGHNELAITSDARRLLSEWDWPGNVRELENVVQRAVVLAGGQPINSQTLVFGPGSRSPQPGAPLPERNARGLSHDGMANALTPANPLANRKLADVEREAILSTLEATGNNKTEAARRLGVTARTLSNKMRLWRELGFVA